MNDIKIFNNPEFGEIRTVVVNSEPYFVGKDIAEILGYANPQKAVREHVDNEDKGMNEMDTPGGKQSFVVINEFGLYSLILFSKLPGAKKFKRWVTSEVLPSIRKNGGYIAGQEELTDEELIARAVLVAQKKIAERDALIAQQQQKINEDKPKVIFANAVSASHTSILIGEMAKILKGNGIDMGQKRLFSWLREHGYLIKRKGTDYNMPTQKAMELGLFEIKEGSYINGSGANIITKTPKVTGKDQQYFVNKFLQSQPSNKEVS